MKFLFLATSLLLLTFCLNAQLRFVAHRGASWYAPENSLGAIRLAWELGCDGAECDIQLTKDKQIVLCHDKNTERVTGQKLEIAQSKYADLKRLNLRLLPNNSAYFEEQSVPLLKEVLKATPKGQLLVMEIKCGDEIFPELQKIVKTYWKTGNIAFIAFNFKTICLAKSLFPDVPCYYLSSSKEDVLMKIPDIKKNKLDGVDLNSKIIDQQLVDELQKANSEIWCWTVDDLDEALKMKNLGIKTITTNRPTWLREQLSVNGKPNK